MISIIQRPFSTNQIVRFVARIWSIVSIGFVLLFIFGEGFSQGFDVASITQREWIMFAFFPVGLLLGLILAWRWEGVGGAITIISFLAFYMAGYLTSGSLPRGPWFVLLTLPGVLFLHLSADGSRGRVGR